MTDIGKPGPAHPPRPMDWGRGHYERSAAALLPAAEAVVLAAALLPGERAVDVGCGTGNVALIAAHGMTTTIEQHGIVFTGASPAAYLEAERTSHPLAIAAFEVLERAGQAEQARERLLRILEEENEDAAAFRSTSRYVVVTATRR